MVVRMFLAEGTINKKNDKKGQGMRYEPVFLVHCVLLKMKSNKAYKFLRNMMLLDININAKYSFWSQWLNVYKSMLKKVTSL